LEWTAGGLSDVTGISSLWHTGMICRSGDSADYSGLDAAVMPRSMVYDIEAHESIRDFLKKVSIVVIIEPSALLGAAQMGLDSVTESVYAGRKRPVFCAMDRNCDGLVDTLSHVLKTELTQVSATNHHSGASTYMIWDGDSDHLQHRMLPNISRYLGLGTELGAAVVKNGFRKALWYGGSRFPVADIQWIGNQYYYELLKLCGKKPTQENFGRYFMTDSGLWNASEEDIQYITVEDENRNMFEIRRSFATRAVKEGFVNIISPAYLLRDYMADNDGLFENDPKAVPTIVPDYVRTVRNTVLRLCLRMSIGSVWENDIRRELERVNVSGDEPGEVLWRELCRTYRSVTSDKEEKHYELPEIRTAADGIERIWNFETFRKKRKFNTETGCMENLWSVTDRQFIRYVTAPLRDIKYIAEDDTGNREHLGAELQGQLFQKHLPGQFMTLGGKYYEVLRVVRDGSLLLQRAADHITGRPEYRQVRQYVLKAAVRSEIMGESRHTAGMQTDIMYADILVRTPAYWQLDKGNDFAHGSRISINGIPERSYSRKKLLRLTFAEGSTGLSDNVRCTLVLLMNEVIRTMFSDQADFLAVVTSEQLKEPLTYHLQDETKEADSSAVYIIEDSQLDLGLLEAVRRNLRKILETCCDYLEWHADRLEGSKAGVRVQTVKRTGGVHIPEGPVSGLVEAAAESAITAAAVECVEKAVSGTTGDIAAKAIGGAVGTAMGPFAGAVVGVAAKNIIGAAANGTESADPYSTRSAYCERHYLLYGGETCPEWIDAGETVSFLKSRGFGNGELKQARKGADKNN
ncbi:MAG: hypothetical protein PUC98_07605, partial [Clostridiales bacterium]|nr:hypothetical protein [Clostridiales bacterium]